MANKTMGQSFPSGYDKIQQQSSAEVVGVVLVKVPHSESTMLLVWQHLQR